MFESEPMQSGIDRSRTADDAEEAVAEIRLGRRAGADARACVGEVVELRVVSHASRG